MTIGDTERGAEMSGASLKGSGRNPQDGRDGVSSVSVKRGSYYPETKQLMGAVVGRENMMAALRRVEGNRGAAGVDEMSVKALRPYLREHWPRIKAELMESRYMPRPVRRVEIRKPMGKGMRELCIPVVVDRLIQQALHQVLQPIFDPGFSESSYGFRPGRSAHQAVRQAREYVAAGRRWVVDIDIEKFFDRVNHDVLMSRVARRIEDKRVLGLIRRYLQAGIMDGGMVSPRSEGTPQGGPLSPLLSNVLLDGLDKELERRGHVFCRYADDCNIYVRSRHAGERVLSSISHYLEKRLRFKVSMGKSAVDRPWNRSFLGYSMTWHMKPRLKVAVSGVRRLKCKLRGVFHQGRGRSLSWLIEALRPLLRGWMNYFSLSEVKGIFEMLDSWIRRKLRCILWRQWKRPYTRARNLMKRGLGEVRAWQSATNGRGPWWNFGASHMNEAYPKRFFDECGLVSLLNRLHGLTRTS